MKSPQAAEGPSWRGRQQQQEPRLGGGTGGRRRRSPELGRAALRAWGRPGRGERAPLGGGGEARGRAGGAGPGLGRGAPEGRPSSSSPAASGSCCVPRPPGPGPEACRSPPGRGLAEGAGGQQQQQQQQSRRLLANARERSRVHTISAAFEALRKQVPCYSYGQKLSKLAILRIACNYILSLARLADLDYSADHSNLSFSECVEQCTRTLQAEGRSKKRKE